MYLSYERVRFGRSKCEIDILWNYCVFSDLSVMFIVIYIYVQLDMDIRITDCVLMFLLKLYYNYSTLRLVFVLFLQRK